LRGGSFEGVAQKNDGARLNQKNQAVCNNERKKSLPGKGKGGAKRKAFGGIAEEKRLA